MRNKNFWIGFVLAILMVASVLAGVLGGRALPAQGAGQVGSNKAADLPVDIFLDGLAAPATAPTQIISYAAKFVCMLPLQPGTFYYGPVAPLVEETTGILIHNPNDFPVSLYKKAVRAPLEEAPTIAPGNWKQFVLGPDRAFRINCDDITKLLTGNPNATFIGTYGIGVEVEGFVVIGVGPQVVSGVNIPRYATLDVTAEYVRGSEFLKKDVNYQPWWVWWWWPLPWRLGYPYNRLIRLQAEGNIDCRTFLVEELKQDASKSIPDQQRLTHTLIALDVGHSMDPTTVNNIDEDQPPALVTLIGKCERLDAATLSVDYLIVSNKSPTDPHPITPMPPFVNRYPWLPGIWYDLPVVMPQNTSSDMNHFFNQWAAQRWIAAGVDANTVNQAMVYYFPYWCGWGQWYWWWHGGDCTDIAVGNAQSLDVEQVNPSRVFYNQWPPITP